MAASRLKRSERHPTGVNVTSLEKTMDTVYRRIDHGSVRYVNDVDEPLDVFDVSVAETSFRAEYPASAVFAVQSDIVEDNPFDRIDEHIRHVVSGDDFSISELEEIETYMFSSFELQIVDP